jgi:multidrug resistance efflux pump
MKAATSTLQRRLPRLTRWFMVLGVVALAGSLIGARVLSNGSGSAVEESGPPSRVIVFGYVDAPEGGVRNLAPPVAARVIETIPESNNLIKQGTTLVKFDADMTNDLLKAAEADLAGAKVQLQGATQRAEQYKSDIEQQKEAINAAQSQLDAANTRLEDLKKLVETKVEKQSKLDAARDDIKSLEAKLSAEKAKLTGIKVLDPQLLVDRAEQDVAAKQAQRDRADKAVQDYTIKAPSNGYVLRVLVNKGDMYSPELKMPPVVFAPAGPRIIRAEVDQEFASRVKKGQRVCIEDDANNQGRWTGTLTRVGDWYAPRRNILPEPIQLHDVRTLECIIDDIEPNDGSLRINQRMRVTIYPEGTEPNDCKGG